MKIIVDSLSGPIKRQLFLAGWRLDRNPSDKPDCFSWYTHERLSGQRMAKSFETMGEAIREFEHLTGYDVIGDTDQCGCPIFTFYCPEHELVASGWDCGNHLFKRWYKTPRACLEALNA